MTLFCCLSNINNSKKKTNTVFADIWTYGGLPGWLNGLKKKNLSAHAGDAGLISGSGRSPQEENGTLLQYSCWDNPMDKRAWRALVHGVTKSWTQISD